MTIIADSREKERAILEGADERKLLSYPNPADPNSPFSFDLQVITKAGQVIGFERKAWGDFVSSFSDGKLDRQCAAVDALIIERDPLGSMMESRGPEWDKLADNAVRHAQRLALSMPVIWTTSAGDTINTLRYYERHDKPLELFENRVKTAESDVFIKILSSLPGINPWRPLPGGKVLADVLGACVDREALIQALGVDSWPSLEYGEGGRRIGPKTAENVRQALL